MVVDDDPIFRMLVRRVAQQMGKADDLVLCDRLQQADSLKHQSLFWVIDVNLPDGLGPDWVKQQRDEGLLQPVLLLSHGEHSAALDALEPCRFQRKPSNLEDLRQLMQGWWP